MKDIAQSICTDLGLTLSLDSLISTTQAILSECNTIFAKRTNTNLDTQEPISGQSLQKTVAAQIHSPAASCMGDQPISLPDFFCRKVKDDYPHMLDTKAKSDELLMKMSNARDLNVQAKSSFSMDDQTFRGRELSDSPHQNYFNENETTTISHRQTASIHTSTVPSTTNEPLQVVLHCNDKLVAALSLDPQGIAGILLAKGLIPENIEAQMRQCFTPREKATILVTTVRQLIEIAPKRFYEFLDILSEQAWTKDIMEVLQSHIGPRQLKRDAGVQAVSTGDQDSSDSREHKSSNDDNVIGEDYTFPKLKSEDKAELEAQLILSADSMRKKFASLLLMVVTSFQIQNINPRKIATAILALTEYDDPAVGKPLLERDKEALMKAQTIDDTFDILRPHMTFFNYEILEFLIDEMGSSNDKRNLQKFLQEFQRFRRQSVFEVPPHALGHSAEKIVDQQKMCVKITRQFRGALLVQSMKHTGQTSSPTQLSFTQKDYEEISAPELGISLEDAKHIQRKLASVLKVKVSSIYLDSASSGSTILTFLLPWHISLADLDSDPDIIALMSNGIHILCGPPGKPEAKELTSNGIVVQWSQPEYGHPSLAKYILYYQKKYRESKPLSGWQKVDLSSLETHTCVPDLSDGDTYVFKIGTESDVGTLQYSNESDPIVISADGILTNNIHKVFVSSKGMLESAISSADPSTIAVMLSRIISKEGEVQISLVSTPSEKAALLITAIEHQVKRAPNKFLNFLNALQEEKISLPGGIMETLWSNFYDNVYEQYLDYLKFLYVSLDKKQRSSEWPPSATKKFFRLAMIKTATVQRGYLNDRYVRMTITGKVGDILRHRCPIQLENIFKETKGQRKVILIEGAPGCGKSTLSINICQQWEQGNLFNQFRLVILIQLRDPAVQNAKHLADLLPCPDSITAQQMAARMLVNNSQDILFILDGWDELPPNLRKNSIFYQLVQPELLQVYESSVIVTSRPIADGDLHGIVSSCVEILGFTADELFQFFTECLKGDTEAVRNLLEKIEENPEVAGSCYLPLNAAILVHLFKSDHNKLPTTLYGIFSSLILNCIERHLKLRTQYKDVSIDSLDQLPEFAKKPFVVLCRLAYDGIMEDKIVFTSLHPDVNTLSLLQGVDSFIGREKALSHNFVHLSIQELLAAWYIATQLLAREQVSKFNELFSKSRFSAVLRFYAAITKLKTPGIKGMIVNVIKKYNFKIQAYHSIRKKGGVLMVSLLHCLHEAQDPSLCESVVQQLQHGLDLRETTLIPSDCLCIGYFLAHACKIPADKFRVNVENCNIDDQGCKYLVSGLGKYLDAHVVTTLLHMNISRNPISHSGIPHLSTLLKIGCVNNLYLSGSDLMSKQDTTHPSFDTFAEQLKNNTTLKTLWLYKCGLNSQGAASLAQALTANKHLERLNISDNVLCDDGIQHLSHALRVNQGLKTLWLVSCSMTDVGLEYLAKSLQHNNVLNQLYVYNSSNNPNRITNKIIPVLTECLHKNHSLTELWLPVNLKSLTPSMEKTVNDVRRRSGLPIIQFGMSVGAVDSWTS